MYESSWISPEAVMKAFENMKRRVNTCIEKNGKHFQYFLWKVITLLKFKCRLILEIKIFCDNHIAYLRLVVHKYPTLYNFEMEIIHRPQYGIVMFNTVTKLPSKAVKIP